MGLRVTTLIQRALLSSYPSRFRARYGAEMTLATAESGSSWRVTCDLARGALRAWLQPDVGTGSDRCRDRMQTSVALVFLAWCASVCSAGVFAKAVDDQPVPGLHSWGQTGYSVAQGVFVVTAAAVLLFGFIYWLLVVMPAVRSRNRAVLIPALAPLPIVGAWLGATALVASFARSYINGPHQHPGQQHPGIIALGVLGIYLVVTVAAVVGCGASAVRALDAGSLSLQQLRPAVELLVVVAIALTAQTIASAVALTRVLDIGGIGVRGALQALPPVVVMLCASAVAIISSHSGIRVLRTVTDAT
jgi:hypothetical protein